ncbi:MAG TPA: hypothetical protein VN915_09860 [Elusimicrobiota bacterium]|nr:hypothetical protein [Elusimicrobiota bacterium]
MAKTARALTEITVLTMIGRTALPIGLTALLTRAFYGHPRGLTLPLVATAAGFLLLAGAASRLNDADFLTKELARGLAFATLIIAGLSGKFYFHRVPHALTRHEWIAAAACSVGFCASALKARS